MSNLSIPESAPYREMQDPYAEGYSLFQEGKYDESSQIFSRLTADYPKIKEIWVALAVSQIRAHQSEEGVKEGLNAFGKAISLDPNDPELHYYSALCHLSLGDGRKASNSLELALETVDLSRSELRQEIAEFLNELLAEEEVETDG